LLYQLLTARSAGATIVEPPADNRLRFMRNVPAELCELVARTVVRQHPQYISTPEDLHTELKALAEALEPMPMPVVVARGGVGLVSVPEGMVAGTGRLGSPVPQVQEISPVAYSPGGTAAPLTAAVDTSTATVSDMSMKLAAARQAAYPTPLPTEARSLNLPVLFMIGLVLFILFFVIGYFLAHALPS
jgi:hypothetical protein